MAEAKIVLASHNKGKLKELREILRGHIDGLDVDTQVVDAASVNAPDVPETGVTFAENSLLKARAVARATGLIAIADDSGLSVDVLGGAPGIFSARWAGRHGDDTANLNLLLAQLSDIAPEHRSAKFCCAASVASPDGFEAVEYGELPGELLTAPAGKVASATTRFCAPWSSTVRTPSTRVSTPASPAHRFPPRSRTRLATARVLLRH